MQKKKKSGVSLYSAQLDLRDQQMVAVRVS
eukprot:SAG22_NODE_1546_length_4151_cov_6.763820_2_plen_30_part_00